MNMSAPSDSVSSIALMESQRAQAQSHGQEGPPSSLRFLRGDGNSVSAPTTSSSSSSAPPASQTCKEGKNEGRQDRLAKAMSHEARPHDLRQEQKQEDQIPRTADVHCRPYAFAATSCKDKESSPVCSKTNLTQEEEKLSRIAELTEELLSLIGEDPEREGLRKTPERVAKSWLELTAGYRQNLETVVNDALFDVEIEDDNPLPQSSGVNDMVVLSDIHVSSLCEHHLLPFTGKVHVGIITNRKVLGLSKVPKICDLYSRRLQVQERLTRQIGQGIERAFTLNRVGESCRKRRTSAATSDTCSNTATGKDPNALKLVRPPPAFSTSSPITLSTTSSCGSTTTSSGDSTSTAHSSVVLDTLSTASSQEQGQHEQLPEVETNARLEDVVVDANALSSASSVGSAMPASALTRTAMCQRAPGELEPMKGSPALEKAQNVVHAVDHKHMEGASASTLSARPPPISGRIDGRALGVAVLFTHAKHQCMCGRGAKAYTCQTATSFFSGEFLSDPNRRSEFMSLVQLQTASGAGPPPFTPAGYFPTSSRSALDPLCSPC
ncbi:unnamed protein product [Amoebophrya sp. A25]|nr:unnamed protein product [Amoebophrya sp. A25]|eukprot:GSA25T00009826001.1